MLLQRALAALCLAFVLPACGDDGTENAANATAGPTACRATRREPPPCGSKADRRRGLADFDAEIDAKARRFDRAFHALNTYGHGVNADLGVPADATAERAAIEDFVTQDDTWDFESASGKAVPDVIDAFYKVAGLYAGAGIAADAFRYLTLSAEGASCEEIDVARGHLRQDLDAIHLAVAITGVPGVIARGFARRDLPGAGQDVEPMPLFDADGNPLPPEKNNGTWRADNSGGLYPDYVWEDSCSRDMLVGWALAFAALWEAIEHDPELEQERKDRLQADAEAIARSLMEVRESGYDLEIRDADGRRTLHGVLHEETIDKNYVPGFDNGFNAIMALGIVGALAYVAQKPDIDAYLDDRLLGERNLHVLARDNLGYVDMGVSSNYSNYNMAFTGGLVASRYLCSEEARSVLKDAIGVTLYDAPGHDRQPAELGQTFFDFTYVAALGGGSPWREPDGAYDEAAVSRGTETLRQFSDAPFWDEPRINCDEAEIASGHCVLADGTEVELVGSGWNDTLLADKPTPMSVRPASNYYWRSNPYQVNGEGGGNGLYPGVDFRLAYWMGRWLVRP